MTMGERVPGLMVWAWAMAATTSPAGSSAGSAPFCTGRVTCGPVAIVSDMAGSFRGRKRAGCGGRGGLV